MINVSEEHYGFSLRVKKWYQSKGDPSKGKWISCSSTKGYSPAIKQWATEFRLAHKPHKMRYQTEEEAQAKLDEIKATELWKNRPKSKSFIIKFEYNVQFYLL